MTVRTAHRFLRSRGAIVTAAMLMLLAPPGAAWAQAPQPESAMQTAPVQPPALQAPPELATPQQSAPSSTAPAGNPGLIEELGKLFQGSLPNLLPSVRSPQEALGDLNTRAKDATESLSRLARPVVVTGRVTCPVAGNGAPDCKTASDKLCQAQGYKEGQSLDTDAAQKCPAKVLLSGRSPEPGECRIDNYVTRALCQ